MSLVRSLVKKCRGLQVRSMSYASAAKSIGLSKNHLDLKDAVRRLMDSELAPYAESIDKENGFSRLREFWKILGRNGLHGVTVKENYGGLGLGYLEHLLVMEEVSRASGSIALSYFAHSNLCVNQLSLNGTEEQKLKYLPKLLSGEHFGALAMSEAEAGSDVVNMKLRASKVDNGGYVLNGSKYWITNGPDADVAVVYAKTDSSAEKKQHGITCFIVEKGFKGFSAGPKFDKLGMRGSNTSELVFEDCHVPRENVLGEVNKGVYVLMNGLDYERLVICGGPIGLMVAAIDVAFGYCHERKTFGTEIGKHQIMQSKMADMWVALDSSRAYAYWVASSTTDGQIDGVRCAAAFLYSAKSATKVALEAIQCLGGSGYVNEFPTGRILRDAKLYEIGAGTSEIRKWLIGRSINDHYLR